MGYIYIEIALLLVIVLAICNTTAVRKRLPHSISNILEGRSRRVLAIFLVILIYILLWQAMNTEETVDTDTEHVEMQQEADSDYTVHTDDESQNQEVDTTVRKGTTMDQLRSMLLDKTLKSFSLGSDEIFIDNELTVTFEGKVTYSDIEEMVSYFNGSIGIDESAYVTPDSDKALNEYTITFEVEKSFEELNSTAQSLLEDSHVSAVKISYTDILKGEDGNYVFEVYKRNVVEAVE